jgi:Leucine-rich repeat (LRR) protein
MTFKFPVREKLKKRNCFKCNKFIDYGEFYLKNFKSINEEKLLRLWQNENLEYYCCLCYDKMMEKGKLDEIRLSLNEKERDILKILELKLNIDIPIVPKMIHSSASVSLKNGKIVGLSLFKCLREFPEEITKLSSLEELNLSWNNIEILPESIVSLTSLKFVDLIGNNLSKIPNIIGDLTSLVELDLSFNKLKVIPTQLGNLASLKKLNLIHNNILNLPEAVINLEKKGLKILL